MSFKKFYTASQIVVLVIFHTIGVLAQIPEFATDYQSLKSSGELPQELVLPSTIEYRTELRRISKNESKNRQASKKQFLLESNFLVDDMLRSGYVLYNDSVGKYVNKVADEILKNEPALRQKIQFYVLRSSEANAFSTDRGIIFVTLGMLARLKDEAQLAFILCHEIVHFQKKHALDLAIELSEIEKGVSKKYVLKKSKTDKAIFKYSYARELEFEADKLGMERYLTTKYALESTEGVFDMLAYSYLPFENTKFDKSIFEEKYFAFPKAFLLDSTNAIKPVAEADDDSQSTHPNTVKRQKAVREIAKNHENQGRQPFVVGQEAFLTMREIARFEQPVLHLHNEEFYRAIYEAYILLKKYPENKYLEKCLVKSLYTAAKYRNMNYENTIKVDSVQGNFQAVCYFIEKLSSQDLGMLAAAEAWKLSKKYPTDSELAFIAQDALDEVLYHQDVDFNTLLHTAQSTAHADSLRTISDNAKIDFYQTYTRGVFAPYLDTQDFKDAWKNAETNAKKREKRKKHYASEVGLKEANLEEKLKKKNGLNLGISKILMVSPSYYQLDGRKKNAVEYEASEISQKHFVQLQKENAKKAGLKLEILDVENIDKKDVEIFNDLAAINDWLSDQDNFSELNITPGFQQATIDALIKKYGAKYFCRTGVIALRHKRRFWPLLAPILSLYMTPLAVAKFAEKPKSFLYFNIIYNGETGAYDAVKFEYINRRDTDAMLNLHSYDAFLQIKSKSK